MRNNSLLRILILALILGSYTALAEATAKPESGIRKIGHIVVIYLENHSFDNLYGLFPGADGIAQATSEQYLQEDLDGKPYDVLPQTHPQFPADLPNRPFDLGRFVRPDEKLPDLTHRFAEHQAQINSGKLNRFAAVSSAKGMAMGYYDGRKLPLWQYARRYTLADHFFQAAFGGSYLNHQWLICACTPHVDSPPAKLVANGTITPDGYAVNTVQPANGPHDPKTPTEQLIAPFPRSQTTIGDRLTEKGISWAWYAGGWSKALAGHPAKNFQFHHQPFSYYQRYAGTEEGRVRLKDETDFVADIKRGRLPPVAFYKPIGELNEHPGYADVISGEKHIAELLKQIEHSPIWKDAVVIVTYDEYGGFWDHVPPPAGDRWGPGSRIPTIIASPFAKRGYVDKTVYDTTSILKLIENRFGLEPLGERDRKANDLSNALKF
jgi:phospholipase C